MPESKRNKLVSLTKTKPKTREHKEFIVDRARSFIDKFKYIYVLSFDNMSTNNFKGLKEDLPDSKFMMGKNGVLRIALGVDEETSYKKHLYRLSEVCINLCLVLKRTYCTFLHKQKSIIM